MTQERHTEVSCHDSDLKFSKRRKTQFGANLWRTRFAFVTMLVVTSPGLALACACGPDFCPDDRRIAPALQAKKASLTAQGFSSALIALLDKADRCVAAIERAPDTFTLMTVKPNGDNVATELSSDNERIARANVLDGRLSAYYKFNVREAFACCQRPAAAQRADWNAPLSLSLGQAIACKKSGNSVQCN
jgi:hypothetical protein